MISVFKLISTSLDTAKQLIAKVTIFGKGDTKQPKELGSYGIDSRPIEDTRGVFASTTTFGKYYVLGYININRKAEVGEMRTFATDENGTFKYNIWQRADGTVLIGNSDVPADYTNFAVKYNELKSDIDALKATVNANATVFNTHTHILTLSAGTGTAAPSATQEQSNNTDFSNIKNDNVKFNS